MEKYNLIEDKSFRFALRIIKFSRYMVKNKREYILSKQVLRCGTSIGANIEEAIGSHLQRISYQRFV
jgi:four helix bundle protein